MKSTSFGVLALCPLGHIRERPCTVSTSTKDDGDGDPSLPSLPLLQHRRVSRVNSFRMHLARALWYWLSTCIVIVSDVSIILID
jgi:hypothetical protein